MSEAPMTEEEKQLLDEAKRVSDEVNRRLKPIEDAFMAYVFAYKVIGYGRMMQLIQEQWCRELGMRRMVSMDEGDGKGWTRHAP